MLHFIHHISLQGSKSTDGSLARATVLYFDGDKAAIAAKWAHPLDLHTLSLRNDLGTLSLRQDILSTNSKLLIPAQLDIVFWVQHVLWPLYETGWPLESSNNSKTTYEDIWAWI